MRGPQYTSQAMREVWRWRGDLSDNEFKVMRWFVENDWRADDYCLQSVSDATNLADFQVFDCITTLAERGLLSVSGPCVRSALGAAP